MKIKRAFEYSFGCKKSLKIPKEYSKAVYRRRTDNTMAKSTKYTHKTKDQVTRTPLKTGGEHKCSERVSCSCSTSDTRRVNLVTNPVICHERGKDREVCKNGLMVTHYSENQ